jgi:apurinic endonuclease APN1
MYIIFLFSQKTRMSRLVFINPDIRIGFHVTKGKTLAGSFENLLETPLLSYQIYLGNARIFASPFIDSTDVLRTRQFLFENNKFACIHGNLLYNMAGSVKGLDDPDFNRKMSNTRRGITCELDIAAGFDSGVVVHIGSCTNKRQGISSIARTVQHVLLEDSTHTKKYSRELCIPTDELKKRRKIYLENAAGEGSKIGSTLNEISEILKKIKESNPTLSSQVGVCIDTQHIFGAGQYDFGMTSDVDRFFYDFDTKIGLDKLQVIHLNDSRVPFGSKKDRHENLGLGYIFSPREDAPERGIVGLHRFIERCASLRIPLIGEPPRSTVEGDPGPGGFWDYAVLRTVCPLELGPTDFCCE